jgi:hypothetical protein
VEDAVDILNVPFWIGDRGSRPGEEIQDEKLKKGDNGELATRLCGNFRFQRQRHPEIILVRSASNAFPALKVYATFELYAPIAVVFVTVYLGVYACQVKVSVGFVAAPSDNDFCIAGFAQQGFDDRLYWQQF